MKESSIENCYIKCRKTDSNIVLFNLTNDGKGIENVSVNLNGYAIIPIEDYEKITGVTLLKIMKK